MPDNPALIPGTLSGRLATTASSVLSLQGREVDVAIGGIPFRLATSQDLPQSVETIPIQKEQFDAETEPGEQSLAFWWRRSQDSWHEGAGNLYQEARGQQLSPSAGFYESQGLDVWQEGQLALLRRMVSSTGTYKRCYAGVLISLVSDTSLSTQATPGGTITTVHTPATGTYADGFVLAGGNFYGLLTNGTLFEGTTAAPESATTWPLNGTTSRMAFGQHRLWVIGGRDIWQPNLSDPASTAQEPVYTNPNKAWSYTCLAEGTSAMYFGGHDGQASSIQAITMDSSGGLPTLTGATVMAKLPDGELIQEIAILAGQYIGIGTNKGFRVGILTGDGGITYGPLLVEPDSVDSCTAITTSGRFFLVSFSAGGVADAYKVDTGIELGDGVFPYARDIECGGGFIKSLAVAGDQVVAVDSAGVLWYQHATELVSSGTLTTGRVRFRTTEKKLFKNLQLETEPLAGSIGVVGLDQAGTEVPIGSMDTAGDTGANTMQLPSTMGPQRQMALKFTLDRDAVDATAGPILHSYVLQALPVVTPQRQIVLPLMCFDQERSHSGMRYGYDGFAEDRHVSLMNLENNSDVVTLQSFNRQLTTGQNVLIDSVRLVQTSPPTGLSGVSGIGGILVVTLRTVNL